MEHSAHHFAILFYAHIVLLLYGVGMMIYGIPQQTKARGSHLVRVDNNIMLFRKPLPLRRATLAAVGFLILLFINVLVLGTEARNPLPAYFMDVLALDLPVLFLYMSGPDDIRLDGSQCTFERTRGWPWKPTVRFGSFDEIKGICISPGNSVWLLLEKPGWITKGVVLNSSDTKSAARALAEDLNQMYGFPIVPYPKT